MKSEFLLAVTQLAAERGLSKESVVTAVEAALASAYKKDSQAAGHDITVRLDPNSGEIKIYALKTVVEPVTDPRREMSQAEAQKYRSSANLADVVEVEISLPVAGRIAAQTAKQVVLQKLRLAERERVVAEFTQRVGELVAGRVERTEPNGAIVVNLGRAEAMLPKEEQIPTERYRPNQTMQFYLLEIARSERGPEVILSRRHRSLLRRLFEREIPEVYNGVVEIRAIAREPGSRSKVAVSARQEGVDPVGSCVGLRGFRIQNIVNELQGESIDVVQWHANPAALVANALSPAQVLKVEPDEANKAARIIVPDRQLSLAIGREGQNVRLAAKLSGWKLEIKSLGEYEAEQAAKVAVVAAAQAPQPVAVQQAAAVPAPVAEAPAPAAPVAPVEPAPAEAAPAEPPVPALTPEEELLLQAGLAPAPAPAEAPAPPAEAPEEAPPQEEEKLWQLPIVTEPSVLRFAEEILPQRAARREGRGREEDRRTKTKKARPARARPAAAPQEEE